MGSRIAGAARLAALFAAALAAAPLSSQGARVLRYSHPNEAESIAGQGAELFARKVAEYSGGRLSVEVFPSSRLGTLAEQAKMAQAGTIAFTHQTAATIGSLYGDMAVLDLPYAYRDVQHLLGVTDPGSPVMTKLGEGLLASTGLRLLSTFYFGTRQLTCDRPIRKPEDLAGLSLRALPFPVYEAAVEGLGASPVPIDWSRTLTAIAAGTVNGQENPVNIVLSSGLYKYQAYLMLTSHIRSAGIVVANEKVWQGLSRAEREAVSRAARDMREFATRACLDQEASDLAALKAKGMKVIGPAEGLDVAAFAARTKALVAARFGERWKDYISMIEATK